jgi:thiol-disulfide isomerase/thioredoxin
MKRILLILAFVAISFAAKAQLPDGTVAPDFTAVDINGNSHTLSEYLDQGKTVIIDISATWCHPCWEYHRSGALEDLYNAYGPEATDEVVVLFVEGDPSTSVQSISGTNTPSDTSVTQGDWTIGSPYPIIDSGAIAQSYAITYFPTCYMICPDGLTTKVDQYTAAELKDAINAGCGANLVGVQNSARAVVSDLHTCSDTADVPVKLTNLGGNDVTSATYELKANGNVVSTYNYTGTLGSFETENITFPNVTLDETATYTVDIPTVNGVAPLDPSVATQPLGVFYAQTAGTQIQVQIYTDDYPAEIRWRIRNSNNALVASGGPYSGLANDAPGGADANTTISQMVTLPNADDCYKVQLIDLYGDGWSIGDTYHGLKIFSGDNLVFEQAGDNIGTGLLTPSAFKTAEVLGTVENTLKPFTIYPNPSNGVFSIRAASALSITVSDLTGKVVYEGSNITDGSTINLSALSAGMYLANVKDATSQSVVKLVIQ